ncbi:hypothetical protein NKR23_g12318 [Pleurostoma richardsiae]|uniref:Uncharacterized protein n=1 Tax=Pleurostoma richardsiae TaxID=41990 RepID=A0AA38R642_9PEZI|nr:hypothetical protein NKR23_g12318 [Pleurostoma richardsiae]
MWGGQIRREALLQKISLLAMLGGVHEGPREHPLTSAPGQERTLTVEQEAEIAGNLAFLSRRRKDSLSVAAIGIEEDEDGQGMVVRLCINGGILSRIEDGVKEMCAMLEQISRQRGSEDGDVESFLGKVIELDSSRILARLRLGQKSKTASPRLLKSHQILCEIAADAGPDVQVKMRNFMGLHRTLTRTGQPPRHELLKELVKAAYDLAQSLNLDHRASRVRSNDVDRAKLGDMIVKLGQYFRAARQLVLAARRTRYRLFRRIRVYCFQIVVPEEVRADREPESSLRVLGSLTNTLDQRRLLQRYRGSEHRAAAALTARLNGTRSSIKVHAEIKLLFFYEAHPEVRRPRVIAANKSSCYLCDLFFRLHGAFQVPSTFGVLNERWILPDWCPVPQSQLDRLAAVLLRFDEALDQQLARRLEGCPRCPDPLESLVAISATWPNSQETTGANASAPGPVSARAASSAEEITLEAGDSIWKQLAPRSTSFTLHFYESHAVVSFTISRRASKAKAPLWIRISLTVQTDQPSSVGNATDLQDIEEGSETMMRTATQGSNGEFSIRWKQQVIHVLSSVECPVNSTVSTRTSELIGNGDC